MALGPQGVACGPRSMGILFVEDGFWGHRDVHGRKEEPYGPRTIGSCMWPKGPWDSFLQEEKLPCSSKKEPYGPSAMGFVFVSGRSPWSTKTNTMALGSQGTFLPKRYPMALGPHCSSCGLRSSGIIFLEEEHCRFWGHKDVCDRKEEPYVPRAIGTCMWA